MSAIGAHAAWRSETVRYPEAVKRQRRSMDGVVACWFDAYRDLVNILVFSSCSRRSTDSRALT